MINETLILEVLAIMIIAIVFIVLVVDGLYLIGPNQVGVVIKKIGGKKMKQGQVIALDGEIGIQADLLVPGLYYRFPIIWNVRKEKIIEIDEDKIAYVTSVDGKPLLPGRITGDYVECNQFQDAAAFIKNGGCKGPQVGFLRPGKYRINTSLFEVTITTATSIAQGQTGIVMAVDGTPLPNRFIIAPQPSN